MPSTALTQPIFRRNKAPVLTGKYFWRFSSSSNGASILCLFRLVDEPALRGPMRPDIAFLRLLLSATQHGVGAAWMKGAARRQLRQVWRVPGDREKRLLAAELRHRAEQSPRIGVLRSMEQIAHAALLDDLAGIHYGHLVAH